MKLIMYQKKGDARLGCLVDDQVIDINLAYEAMLTANKVLRPRAKAGLMIPPETIAFLEGGDESLQAAREAVQWIGARRGKRSPSETARLLRREIR